MTEIDAASLLPVTLSVAVLLCVEALKKTNWADIARRIPELSEMIASHGDDILYRSRKPGETDKAFNALAEVIAILSFAPGGVTAFETHWENRHPEQPEEVTS